MVIKQPLFVFENATLRNTTDDYLNWNFFTYPANSTEKQEQIKPHHKFN
jgi:hypothetical protein